MNPQKTLRARALDILSRQEISRAELKRKLAPHAESEEEIERVLNEFADRRWQSDERYAEAYIHSKSRKHGSLRLKQALAQKGVDEETVRAFLPDRDNELASAVEVVRKKFKRPPADYAEKLKQEHYQIDDSLLKPYLALDKAVEGMFAVAHKLYGLHFTLTEEVEKYHPEVQTYKVTDENGNYLALFYTDFFPRAGKRNGAWMTSYKEQYRDEQGNDSRPHISIVCNFTRPTDTAPSLLTFNELTTLFHEFGHALHGMLSKVTYPSLSGTNVARDFVELPSQLMENWCYEEETLRLFATHYQTGEPLPIEWVKKVKAVEDFMKGILNVRQLNFGFLDMEWHTYPHLERLENVRTFEQTVTKATQLYPPIDVMCISPAFSHIFSGGYAAGYYSYKWSEALEEGALEIFKQAGFFNKAVATRFRKEILERGSSEKESILYKRFRG